MKIKKNDTILVTKGKYKGKKAKVLKVFPKENRLIAEGINIVKRHRKPTKTDEKGKILEMPSPIFSSNVKLICKNCKKPTKIGTKIITKKGKEVKVRFCKKCKKET